MPMCFIWLQTRAMWREPTIEPQIVDSDILDYQLANANHQAVPEVVKRTPLTDAEVGLTLAELAAKHPI